MIQSLSVSGVLPLCIHFLTHLFKGLFYRSLGYHHDATYNFTEATASHEKALALAKSAGSTMEQTKTLNYLAITKLQIGEYTAGQTLAIEAQMLARSVANFYEEALALKTEACCRQELGDLEPSIILLHRGRDLLRLCGMSGSNLDNIMMNNEAGAHFEKSQYAEARAIQTHIAQTTSPEQDMINHAFALLSLGEIDVATEVGGIKDVAHMLETAKTLFSSTRFTHGMILCEITMANLELKEGDPLAARAAFNELFRRPWVQVTQVSSMWLESMADYNRWGGTSFHQTWKWAVVYLAHATKFQRRLALHKALLSLGNVFLNDSDEVTAENLFTVALDGFTDMDVHQSRADCMLHLGDIASKRGNLAMATTLWTGARPLFERSLQTKDVSRIDCRLAGLEQDHERKNVKTSLG
jgi:tetratricopeptide (TPR) repeat protein